MEFEKEINNECAFHIEPREGFCSPPEVIEKIKLPTVKNVEELKDKYNCPTEVCVLEHPSIQKIVGDTESIVKTHFKPTGPRLSEEWLSNIEIDAVLSQIQKKYADKHFLHIPFQMIDFDKVGSELSKLPNEWPKHYMNGYRTFGTVINTDKSTGKGLHWFAVFGDFLPTSNPYTIEYFNSSGERPYDEIKAWMKRMKYCMDTPIPIIDVNVTNIQNQKDDHSCGPYSLYYIMSRLDGVPHHWFRKNKIGDEKMHKFREFLFRPN